MGCDSCSSGRGGLPAGCKNNGACGTSGCTTLPVFDWLTNMELPNGKQAFDVVEVRFKASRKEFYRIGDNKGLVVGDAVAVDAAPGHDLGMVSMTGELVRLQMKKLGVANDFQLKSVYRKAKPVDIEKWQLAVDKEKTTMMRARAIAVELKLNMKISDVEYQGDGNKAIFYYTADDRVDFREMIKVLADEFKVRVEMRQIGSRQESARLGGIGSCGRELCCSTWLRDFRSVNTSAARYQQLSLNPQKLAGQCGKLKCCLNYELDSYLDAIKDFPETNVKLETRRGWAFHQKTDIFRRILFYSYTDDPGNFIAVPVDRVKLILELNKKSEKPEALLSEKEIPKVIKTHDYENVVGQDSLTRFDASKNRNKKKKKNNQGGQRGPEAVNANNNQPQNNSPKPPQQANQNQQRRPAQQQNNQQQRPAQQQNNQQQKPAAQPNNNQQQRPPQQGNNNQEQRNQQNRNKQRPQQNRPPQKPNEPTA
jgi:cell fate regulator YaaT (PSP1 superfamily)